MAEIAPLNSPYKKGGCYYSKVFAITLVVEEILSVPNRNVDEIVVHTEPLFIYIF